MRKITSAILAGGLGLRMRGVVGENRQKVLCEVAGKPLISYSIDLMDQALIGRIVFTLGYRGEEVRRWAESQGLAYQLDFLYDDKPGVKRAVLRAFASCDDEEMVVCNGDEVRLGLDLGAVLDFHRSTDRLATLVATQTDHLYRHRLLCIDQQNSLLLSSELHSQRFVDSPQTSGLINTGLLVIKRSALTGLEMSCDDGWSGIINPLCESGELAVFTDLGICYFNVGTEEEYQEICKALSP